MNHHSRGSITKGAINQEAFTEKAHEIKKSILSWKVPIFMSQDTVEFFIAQRFFFLLFFPHYFFREKKSKLSWAHPEG